MNYVKVLSMIDKTNCLLVFNKTIILSTFKLDVIYINN